MKCTKDGKNIEELYSLNGDYLEYMTFDGTWIILNVIKYIPKADNT